MSNNPLVQVLESEQLMQRFSDVAPNGMNYAAEKGFAVQILKNNSYLSKVAHGSPKSLQAAVVNVAAIGLSLNPAKKQAYLLPRSVKNEQGKWESRVFLEPSYMGLCDIATLSGRIEWVQARPVYSSDVYENNGPDEKPTHKSNPFAKSDDRGGFVGVYCVAKTNGGDYLTTEMTEEEVNSIRDRSEAWKQGSGPWKTDYIEMAKKSVIRNAFKTWPKTGMERAELAVNISNENEGFERIVTEPETKEHTADQKTYFDSLLENNDALSMFVLRETLVAGDNVGAGASIWGNLTNSFPKGKKGYYGQIVMDLVNSGRATFDEYLLIAQEGVGDELAIAGIAEELTDDQYSLLVEKSTPEVASELLRVKNGE